MPRAGNNGANRENAFSLTFPKKRAVQLGLADKWTWLITNIDEVGRDHRHGKRDRDCVVLRNLSARRLDDDAAGIGLRIRGFFFLFFVDVRSCRDRWRSN